MRRFWTILLVMSLVLGGSAGVWTAVRLVFPARRVNRLNYLFVHPGMTYDDVVEVLGPCLDEGHVSTIDTGEMVNFRDEAARPGDHDVVWRDQPMFLSRFRITVTFRDGRAVKTSWWEPMP